MAYLLAVPWTTLLQLWHDVSYDVSATTKASEYFAENCLNLLAFLLKQFL